jgi:two-component system, sensor histidine kinase and response regulator
MGQEPTAVPAALPMLDDLDVLHHELGNVLHGVACVAGLLRDSTLDTQQRRWLATIDQACGQIHGILEHARRARCDPAGLPQTIRLNGVALLEDTLLAHAPAAAAQGVELLLRIEPGLPGYWRSEPCLLRQLLDNLLGNAIRYARDATVVVEASSSTDAAGPLVIRILDSGPGIEDAERLFEPGRRGLAGLNGPPGSGLGLFISRCIVETLGGEIRGRNRRSGGACFEVRLPRTLDGEIRDWPVLHSLAGLECRLDLDPDRVRCIGALLERLGVPWRVDRPRSKAASGAALSCVIRPAKPAAAGVMIRAERSGRAVRPVHVPGPVLESSLESALYRLLLDSRLGANPREARG